MPPVMKFYCEAGFGDGVEEALGSGPGRSASGGKLVNL